MVSLLCGGRTVTLHVNYSHGWVRSYRVTARDVTDVMSSIETTTKFILLPHGKIGCTKPHVPTYKCVPFSRHSASSSLNFGMNGYYISSLHHSFYRRASLQRNVKWALQRERSSLNLPCGSEVKMTSLQSLCSETRCRHQPKCLLCHAALMHSTKALL